MSASDLSSDPSSEDLARKVEGVQNSLVREQCYVCWMTPNDDAPPLTLSKEEMRLVHHDYLLDLERRGILFGAGPFVDENGHRHGAGMIIIRAGEPRRGGRHRLRGALYQGRPAHHDPDALAA